MSALPAINQPGFSLFNPRLPDDSVIEVLNYLSAKDLRVADSIHRIFRSHIRKVCEEHCQSFLPSDLPFQVDHKYLWLQRLPRTLGYEYFPEYLRNGAMVPIPENYLKTERKGCRLMFAPYIPKEVDENDPVMLSEASDNKKSRFQLDQDKVGLPLAGKTKKLKIPSTMNNVAVLAQKYLKKDSLFGGGGGVMGRLNMLFTLLF